MDIITNLLLEIFKSYKDDIDITIVIWSAIILFIIGAYFFLKKHRLDSIASHGMITTNVIHQLQSHANTLQSELDSVRPHVIELGKRLEDYYNDNKKLQEEILELKSDTLDKERKYNLMEYQVIELAKDNEILHKIIKEWEVFWIENKKYNMAKNATPPMFMKYHNSIKKSHDQK